MERAGVVCRATALVLLASCNAPAPLPPADARVYAFDGPSHAIDRCAFVIDVPGNYHVTNDLVNCPGHAIAINASGVTLRLNGHTLSGQSGALIMDVGNGVSVGRGVIDGVSRVHIIGPGKITGFWAGILFEQVRHSIVVNVTLENNHYGFVLNAGFTAMQGGNRSRFNTITGNTLDANFGHGITINGGDDNLFSGNAILATKKGVGLFLYAAARNVVISNRVAGNDVGIMVDTPDSSSRENTIVDNDVSGSRRHDLVDRWNDCSHNTWSTNRSGTNATACIK